jgi:ankyrin repeat protein
MFSGIFGSSPTIPTDITDKIVYYCKCSKNSEVVTLLDKYNISTNDYKLTDEYDQNLLHIAVLKKNYSLAKQLLVRKIDKFKKNFFGDSPIDIALKNHDIKMLEILFEIDNETYLKSENRRLTDKVSLIEIENKKLADKNDGLIQKNLSMFIRIDEDAKNIKRKREENDELVKENKKIKLEIESLRSDNTVLQDTVKNLREAIKKN